MALIISTWCWGQKYPDHYVNKLAASVHRNLTEGHRFICFTDRERNLPNIEQVKIPAEDMHLTEVPGCFVRMRVFDTWFQSQFCVQHGDRIVNIDLDSVVTGPLDKLFRLKDDFAIIKGINGTNPCPNNGSLWTLRAGARPDVWSEFSIENYHKRKVPFHAFPDDQGWFHHMMPNATPYGPKHGGVYGFKKNGWPSGDDLPDGARLVVFPGWRDPAKFEHLTWVRENWR